MLPENARAVDIAASDKSTIVTLSNNAVIAFGNTLRTDAIAEPSSALILPPSKKPVLRDFDNTASFVCQSAADRFFTVSFRNIFRSKS